MSFQELNGRSGQVSSAISASYVEPQVEAGFRLRQGSGGDRLAGLSIWPAAERQ